MKNNSSSLVVSPELERIAREAADQITYNTEAASKILKGPRFAFDEYRDEQQAVILKAIQSALSINPEPLGITSKKRNLANAETPTPSTDESREQTGLAPCPFCGEQPNNVLRTNETIGSAYYEIECENKNCGVCPIVNENLNPEVDGDDALERAVDRAFAAWNRRVVNRTTWRQYAASARAVESKKQIAGGH